MVAGHQKLEEEEALAYFFLLLLKTEIDRMRDPVGAVVGRSY